MLLPDPDSMNAAHALGLLLTAAIDHLTASSYCCPYCCPACAGLSYYWSEESDNVSDIAVDLALGNQRPSWRMDDGKINWPYLVLFWNTPEDHDCAVRLSAGIASPTAT